MMTTRYLNAVTALENTTAEAVHQMKHPDHGDLWNAMGALRLVELAAAQAIREVRHLLAATPPLPTDLAAAIAMVVADHRASWPDDTATEAVAAVRNTMRLPEEAPVPGGYPLDDDGTPLAAAYRMVLTATDADLAVVLGG